MLPLGLSALVAVLSSDDLDALLDARELPSLARILQSFSPLPKITTRTTALTPIEHPEFPLRFAPLPALEAYAREQPEARAGRFVDWVGARIAKNSAGWIEEYERNSGSDGEGVLPPAWWDELASCVEGERAPERSEGWNHPVAVVLAVSTHAPNPLQALSQLHARPPELPVWVDTTHLRYTLIVHTADSPLSDDEAIALHNAAKKQYGLHTYLLTLDLPTDPPPPPVPVPPIPPSLPPPPQNDATPDPAAGEDVIGLVAGQMRMGERDIAQTAKFVREFVTMSLVPWMEKCVLDWNENFSSTRRLPSRLFSSTRRLFGSGPASPASTTPISPVARTHTSSSSISSSTWAPPQLPTTFPQQRRLAEFATILGDLKTAIPVWDAVRKDAKGGSDVLPLLLAPGPASAAHAQHALTTLAAPAAELSAAAQVRALTYAVRWALGLNPSDFLSPALDGERWLVWAAARAEEPPTALLLAHAGWCAAKRGALRRAALWYLAAAGRLEKSGIKPLTLHFLRRAHALYIAAGSREKQLSPTFWDAHSVEPNLIRGFDAVLPGIEYALGRLYYTTGDVARAVRFFLSLLRASAAAQSLAYVQEQTQGEGQEVRGAMDKEALDDFRVAFQHLQGTTNDKDAPPDLTLPVSFTEPLRTRVRLPGDSDSGTPDIWTTRSDSWRAFWKNTSGNAPGTLAPIGGAAAGEVFWVDLSLRNPLSVDVALCDLSVELGETVDGDAVAEGEVEVESVKELVLGAGESAVIPLAVRARKPGTLYVLAARYTFLGLLPARESLASRGKRLHDTPVQRQGKVYAPDTRPRVEVRAGAVRLAATFVEDARMVLGCGECKRMRVFVRNAGKERIKDVWVVRAENDVFVLDQAEHGDGREKSVEVEKEEVVSEPNSLKADLVQRLEGVELDPGESAEFWITLHAGEVGEQELCLLFVFRSEEGGTFYSTRVTRSYEVEALLELDLQHKPSHHPEHAFLLNMAVRNVSTTASVELVQTSTVSPAWSASALTDSPAVELHPNQVVWTALGAPPNIRGANEETSAFVEEKLSAVLFGTEITLTPPPSLDLLCNHTSSSPSVSFLDPQTTVLLRQSRRLSAARRAFIAHQFIPPHLHPYIFPLYHPLSLDIVLHWRISTPGTDPRTGFIRTSTLLGALHGTLDDTLTRAQNAKVSMSMYAETTRERAAIAEAVRVSEWNAEMCPVLADVSADSEVVSGVRFALRNFSPTKGARYVLRLAPPRAEAHFPRAPGENAPPSWVGRLVHRGELAPLQSTSVLACLHTPRADVYALGGWALEVECDGRRYISGTDGASGGTGTAVLVVNNTDSGL